MRHNTWMSTSLRLGINDVVMCQARLDKLARTIARTKLKDIYSHLSSSQRSRQKAALKLMSSVVLRGKLIAVEVATNFDFTLEALKKLAQHPFKALVVKATQGLLNHSARYELPPCAFYVCLD